MNRSLAYKYSCLDSFSNPGTFFTSTQKNLHLGGDEEDRTPDPLLARQVLSQLSYTPIYPGFFVFRYTTFPSLLKWPVYVYICFALIMVGPSRLELPTSRLSGVRSNHLSYEPIRVKFELFLLFNILFFLRKKHLSSLTLFKLFSHLSCA